MHHSIRLVLAGLLLFFPLVARGAGPPSTPGVVATIETTLSTAPGKIRQFAFDGDPASYFASAKNAGKTDHFTLIFDEPTTVTSIVVTTGRPGGGDKLDEGVLESSADGKEFAPLAKFTDGLARWKSPGRKIQAIRIRPTADMQHPLAIREFAIESSPALAIFTHPVEFIVNVDDAPGMKKWAERVARLCERWYPRISKELKSDGFKPPRVVTMTLSSRYDGVAYASGNRIVGSVNYFRNNPKDVGAMIHETVHIVQQYRTWSPGWLVEGIADYVRFFKYEPGKLGPINPRRARYNDSYRTSAAFLAYLSEKYDKQIVRKLNKAMREGEYKEAIFKQCTGKTLQALGEEWRGTLRR